MNIPKMMVVFDKGRGFLADNQLDAPIPFNIFIYFQPKCYTKKTTIYDEKVKPKASNRKCNNHASLQRQKL
jgi:hypothetical protein